MASKSESIYSWSSLATFADSCSIYTNIRHFWDIHPRLLVFLTFQCFWLIITAADHGIGLILLNPIPLKHLIKKGNCPTVYIIHFFNGKTAPPFHFRLYLTELIYTRRLISSLTGLPICCFCYTWKMATFNCLWKKLSQTRIKHIIWKYVRFLNGAKRVLYSGNLLSKYTEEFGYKLFFSNKPQILYHKTTPTYMEWM